MARVRPKPKTRWGGRGKQAARRRAIRRRRSRLRWFAAGLGAIALGVIVFLVTRPDAPEGPATAALTGGDFHSMIVDPQNPDRLFAGGHTAVSISIDGGKTWREVKSLQDADAMGWAFTADQILVGGHPGIRVSTDGGKTFRQENRGLPSTDIHALGGGGGVIYAASPQAGVLVSTDGRKTWEVRSRQAGRSFMGRILVDPQNVEHLLAPDLGGGVAESHDGGRTWKDIGGVRGTMWVSWDPSNPWRIVASGQDRAVLSTNGGTSWERIPIPEGAQIIEMSSTDPDLVYAGRHEGQRVTVFVSRDGGQSWTRASRATG